MRILTDWRCLAFLPLLFVGTAPGGQAAPASVPAQPTPPTAVTPMPPAPEIFREIQQILGAPGRMEEGAFVVPIPRADLRVTVMGEPVPPGFDLTSPIAWTRVGNRYMTAGYLVVLQEEMNPVVAALDAANIGIAALVNHHITEQPRIMYVHFQATGNGLALARGIRAALARTGTLIPPPPVAAQPPALSVPRIQQLMGRPALVEGGVVRVTQGRTGVRIGGVNVPPGMGPYSVAFFTGTEANARVGGEVVMTAGEIQNVIRTFRQAGFTLMAQHNHMAGEEPRLYFLHYAGAGTAADLARVVRTAFDQTRSPVRR